MVLLLSADLRLFGRRLEGRSERVWSLLNRITAPVLTAGDR
jgi:hypothetical protein